MSEFRAVGPWFALPWWRKALLLATLRPYYEVKGYGLVARQWLALRLPNRPLHPMAWLHESPCPDEAEGWHGHHDEFHALRDKCVIPSASDSDNDRSYYQRFVTGEHYLEYERDMEMVRALTDRFDQRVGRWYAFSPEVAE